MRARDGRPCPAQVSLTPSASSIAAAIGPRHLGPPSSPAGRRDQSRTSLAPQLRAAPRAATELAQAASPVEAAMRRTRLPRREHASRMRLLQELRPVHAGEAAGNRRRSLMEVPRGESAGGTSEQSRCASWFTLDGCARLRPHAPPCAALRLLSSFAPPACSLWGLSWALPRVLRSWGLASSRTAMKIRAQECSGRRASGAVTWFIRQALGLTPRVIFFYQDSFGIPSIGVEIR